MKYIVSISVVCLGTQQVYSQGWQPSVGVWKFSSIHGELKLKGLYSNRNTLYNEIPEEQTSAYYIGGISLNTKSYLWKPDVVSFNISGEYNPETRNEKYLSIPDRSEVRTLKKLDLQTTVFSNKSLNLTAYLNLDQNYFNRENLTNIRSNNRQYGTVLSFQNRILPVNLSYRNLSWDQTETESGRIFTMDQQNFRFNAARSFFTLDKHSFDCDLNSYEYSYDEISNTQNTIFRLALNDQIYFDKEKKYSFSSDIRLHKQQGTQDYYKLDAAEKFSFDLPYRFLLRSSYHYYLRKDELYTIANHRLRSSLRHQLFESLESNVYIDVPIVDHTLYSERNLKGGVDFRYTKKTFFGKLKLGYAYYHHFNSTESDQGELSMLNEQKSFDNSGTFMLNRPFVSLETIFITDLSGTIIYQEGLDYLVSAINDYVEIVRIPGGLIEEEQDVLVDYTAVQPASYRYNANNNTFNSGLVFFDNNVELYYRYSSQHFRDPFVLEYLTLNEYEQNVIGGRLHYKFLSGGVEYDLYHSNLVPYKKINYFLNMNFRIGAKILLSMNGLYRDYLVIGSDVDHRYMNISSRLAYSITRSSKINLQLGYLKQEGRNIDLDLLTGRIEFTTNLRKLYFMTGLNLYRRNYLNNDYNYSRAYIQLVRKF